jgi:hypothetical protein
MRLERDEHADLVETPESLFVEIAKQTQSAVLTIRTFLGETSIQQRHELPSQRMRPSYASARAITSGTFSGGAICRQSRWCMPGSVTRWGLASPQLLAGWPPGFNKPQFRAFAAKPDELALRLHLFAPNSLAAIHAAKAPALEIKAANRTCAAIDAV